MNNKKGFTLVELIAVIVLIAMTSLVVVASITNQLDNQEKKNYELYKETILSAAELYVEPRRNLYPELKNVGDFTYIKLEEIIGANLLDSEIENPKTDEIVDPSTRVKVTIGENNILIFELMEE